MKHSRRTAGGWTYTETVDPDTATIVVTGRVDHASLDLLCATVEQLHDNGHRTITVTLSGADSVQEGTTEALTSLASRLGRNPADLVVN